MPFTPFNKFKMLYKKINLNEFLKKLSTIICFKVGWRASDELVQTKIVFGFECHAESFGHPFLTPQDVFRKATRASTNIAKIQWLVRFNLRPLIFNEEILRIFRIFITFETQRRNIYTPSGYFGSVNENSKTASMLAIFMAALKFKYKFLNQSYFKIKLFIIIIYFMDC